MNVETLIEVLKGYPPNAKVLVGKLEKEVDIVTGDSFDNEESFVVIK